MEATRATTPGPGRIHRAALGPGLVLLAFLISSCAQAAAGDVARSTVTPAAAVAGNAGPAAAAIEAFGIDVLRAEPGGNLVFSPASIGLALSMARVGAAGETASQMDAVLHDLYGSSGGNGINSLRQALDGLSGTYLDALGSRQELQLRIADAAFSQRGYPLKQAYLDALARIFDAGLRLADFSGDLSGAMKQVNGWVSDQTAGRIPQLLSQLDPATRLVLVNAIYMKAAWSEPFLVQDTSSGDFTKLDGSKVRVPTMQAELHHARYGSGAGWQAVELGYGPGRLAMDLVLPDDPRSFEAGLDVASFERLVASLQPSTVQVALPRFRTETKTELSALLASLGMPFAFDPERADFSGITDQERLFISAVVHQANISVDEKGTEAAAATAVVMAAALAQPSPSVRFDRPFLFAVRDTETGTILFLGRIVDPSA